MQEIRISPKFWLPIVLVPIWKYYTKNVLVILEIHIL